LLILLIKIIEIIWGMKKVENDLLKIQYKNFFQRSKIFILQNIYVVQIHMIDCIVK
jgi:hypothetical protein